MKRAAETDQSDYSLAKTTPSLMQRSLLIDRKGDGGIRGGHRE